MIGRRRFILGLVALSSMRARADDPARAPQLVLVATMSANKDNEINFIDEMRQLGWVEGGNIAYDRYDDRKFLPEEAARMVARKPQVMFASVPSFALAAFARTRTIPIVVGALGDPVKLGLAKSLARPGGNVTGIVNIGWELAGKRLQLLHEALPTVRRAGFLMFRPYASNADEKKLLDLAANPIGITVLPVAIDGKDDLPEAFVQLSRNKAEALLTSHNSPLHNMRKDVLDLASRHRLAVIGPRSEFAEGGALLSYGASLSGQMRRAAHLADSILRGANPASMPIEQPTKFELVINLKTAKALGLTISQSVLLRADEVIQ
jgi:putative ABC transport system substrate-binding protein